MARFIQPDSVVPEDLNSQALNRYSYCINNPLKFTDPTGQSLFSAIAAIVSWLATPEVATAIVAAAIVGAGMAAATGGDVLKGALSGAIGGMFGVGFNPVMAMAGGAVGALVTGGDPLMGAMTAGISAGVGACFAKTPLPGVFGDVENDYFAALMFSTASGALCGGVTAEIFGGDFGQGAIYGATSASSFYVVTKSLAAYFDFLKTRLIDNLKEQLLGRVEEHALGSLILDAYESASTSTSQEKAWGYDVDVRMEEVDVDFEAGGRGSGLVNMLKDRIETSLENLTKDLLTFQKQSLCPHGSTLTITGGSSAIETVQPITFEHTAYWGLGTLGGSIKSSPDFWHPNRLTIAVTVQGKLSVKSLSLYKCR